MAEPIVTREAQGNFTFSAKPPAETNAARLPERIAVGARNSFRFNLRKPVAGSRGEALPASQPERSPRRAGLPGRSVAKAALLSAVPLLCALGAMAGTPQLAIEPPVNTTFEVKQGSQIKYGHDEFMTPTNRWPCEPNPRFLKLDYTEFYFGEDVPALSTSSPSWLEKWDAQGEITVTAATGATSSTRSGQASYNYFPGSYAFTNVVWDLSTNAPVPVPDIPPDETDMVDNLETEYSVYYGDGESDWEAGVFPNSVGFTRTPLKEKFETEGTNSGGVPSTWRYEANGEYLLSTENTTFDVILMARDNAGSWTEGENKGFIELGNNEYDATVQDMKQEIAARRLGKDYQFALTRTETIKWYQTNADHTCSIVTTNYTTNLLYTVKALQNPANTNMTNTHMLITNEVVMPGISFPVFYHSISYSEPTCPEPEEGGCDKCALAAKGGFSTPGSAWLANRSVGFDVSLGRYRYGDSAGSLSLHFDSPNSLIASPEALQLDLKTGNGIVSTNGSGVFASIQADQTYVDVVVESATKYRLDFYEMNAGVPQTNEAAFVKWTVNNPDTSGNTYDELEIIETRGGSSITNAFEWIAADNAWTLTTGNGLRKERKIVVEDYAAGTRTVTTEISDPVTEALARRQQQVFQHSTNGLLLLQSSVGLDESLLTTSHTYNTDGTLRQTDYPDGGWVIHEYDAYERITKTYSAFKNQGPTTNASLCRVVERDYSSPSGSGDDATISTNSPRLVIEKLLGSEIRRTYSLYSTNQLKTIQCQTVGAAWDASDNLVTTTDVIATGMHAGFAVTAQIGVVIFPELRS